MIDIERLKNDRMPPENERPEVDLPPYLKMYEISGQDPITERSHARYIKDKDQDSSISDIRELAQDPPQVVFKDRIRNASGKERASLIASGLEDPNVEVQKVSAELIWTVSGKEEAALRTLALERIKKGLADPDIEAQRMSAQMIRFLRGEEGLASLIQLGLKNSDVVVQEESALNINHVDREERSSLLKFGLELPDIGAQKAVARMIWSVPEEEQGPLRALLIERIQQGLEDPRIEEQKGAVEMIVSLADEQRAEFIKVGLKNPDLGVRMAATKLMWSVPQEERTSLSEVITANIKEGLDNSRIEVQKASAEMVKEMAKCLGQKEQVPLRVLVLEHIKRGLEDPSIEVQKAAVEMIAFAPEEEKQGLFHLVVKKGLGEELVRPPLYDNTAMDSTTFSRQAFAKTGSRTTLLGGELRDKAIIRHITPEAFLSWQRLYEDYALWQEANFDYVPIEPIQSYRLNRHGLVDIFSGVLDLSLDDWQGKTKMFGAELNEQRRRILRVLDKLEIKHGHTHGRNFCLRFFRDDAGKIDFERIPRLYLIDFDQASSP